MQILTALGASGTLTIASGTLTIAKNVRKIILLEPRFNIQHFYVLPTQGIYVFCVDLRANSDYFPIRH